MAMAMGMRIDKPAGEERPVQPNHSNHSLDVRNEEEENLDESER
jgi:hypothetical protein